MICTSFFNENYKEVIENDSLEIGFINDVKCKIQFDTTNWTTNKDICINFCTQYYMQLVHHALTSNEKFAELLGNPYIASTSLKVDEDVSDQYSTLKTNIALFTTKMVSFPISKDFSYLDIDHSNQSSFRILYDDMKKLDEKKDLFIGNEHLKPSQVTCSIRW